MDSYSDYAHQWASKRQSGKHLAHDKLEKPALNSLLGDVTGKHILCLGCGSGEECWSMLVQGASLVHGIDISKSLIEHARYLHPEIYIPTENQTKTPTDTKNTHNHIDTLPNNTTNHGTNTDTSTPNTSISFEVGDIGAMQFGTDNYDIVYSSLTLHYIQDWQPLLHAIKNTLKPNGILVFSTHHPVKWGAARTRTSEYNEFMLGYGKDKKDHTASIKGDYLGFYKIQDTLFGQMKVEYYNRSISRIFDELQQAGFAITALLEPIPDITDKTIPQDFIQTHTKIPLFLVIKAELSTSS